MDEQHVLARYNAGLVYLQQHQLHQALEAFAKAQDALQAQPGTDPEDDGICANLGITYVRVPAAVWRGNGGRRRGRLTPAALPAHGVLSSFFSFLQLRLGHVAAALPLLARACVLSPATAAHHLNHGEALAVAGRYAEAAACLDAYLALEPADAHGYERRAFLRGRAGLAAAALADTAAAGALAYAV